MRSLGQLSNGVLRFIVDKAREARQLGPETLCEFLNENSQSTLESGRTPNAATSGLDGRDTRVEDLLRPSWSTGTGLGTEDEDNQLELDILREGHATEGDVDVLRLEAWVNQVRYPI